MRAETRETMIAACEFLTTVLDNDWYTDSAHDEFQECVDRLRWAYECEEEEMNGNDNPPTFEAWFETTFGHPFDPDNEAGGGE